MSENRILATINGHNGMRRKFHRLEIGQRRAVLELLAGEVNEKNLKKAIRKVKRSRAV